MKKKIILSLIMIVAIACMLAFAVSADSVHNGKVDLDATVTLNDGTVVNLFDPYGNALIWYVDAKSETGYSSVRADSGAGEEGYTGGSVVFNESYQFGVGNSTVGVKTAYEVNKLTITINGSSFDDGNIVVFNVMDDDVLTSKGNPFNCFKDIFWSNTNLQYAYLRLDTVAIQANALNACTNLKYINLEDLFELRQIGGGQPISGCKKLFAGENKVLDLTGTKLCALSGTGVFNAMPIAGLKLPSTVASIGEWNIQGTAISSFAFPTGVTTIQNSQFNDCKSLKEIYISSTTTSIANRAFNATALEKVFYLGTLDQLNALLDNTGADNNAPFWSVVGENRSNLISYTDYLSLEDKSGKYVVYDYTDYCTAYGHTKGESATSTVNPTCTENGSATYTCTKCSESFTVVVKKNYHSYQATVNEPTCVAVGSLARTCSACTYEKTFELPAAGHDYVAAVTEPTCTEGGYTTYTCSVCDDEYTDNATEANGHKWNGGACENCDATRCASIGDNSYNSFEEVMKAAQGEDQVYIYEKIVVEGDVTWDFDEHIVIHFAKVEDNYSVVVKGNLTIKHLNCNFDQTEYGIGVQKNASLTITGGSFAGSHTYLVGSWGKTVISGGTFYATYCAVNAFDGTLIITDGKFTAYDDDNTDEYPPYAVVGAGDVYITGGFFNTDVTDYLAAGYIQDKDDNGHVHICLHSWTEEGSACEYGCGETRVAYIGNTNYKTFEEAYAAANEGETIVVLETILLGDFTFNKNVTINAQGISSAPAFRVLGNVTVTAGTIDATTGTNSYAFIVGNADTKGTLTIKNGKLKGVTSVISITNGTANIEGGTFETGHDNEGTDYGATYLLNCMDAAYANGTAVYNITGGSFVGFNPQNNAAEGANTNFLTSKYTVVNENGVYSVVELAKVCKHETTVIVDYIYANGFDKDGIEVSMCTVCDSNIEKTASKLFEFLGYSVPDDGRGKITFGYDVNNEAIAEYEAVTGNTLSYGVFAALNTIGTNDVFAENSGAITNEVAKTSIAFEFKMTGLENYKDLYMALGAYVIVNGEVSYMQGGKPAEGAKYEFVSYNLVSENTK